jgi:WD40 repeat protein
LYDHRKYTRAAAVAILTSLMAPECHEFNLTLVHLALKAAVDGAEIVRLALVYLVGRYIFLSSAILPPDECPLDWFVRRDAAAFMAQPVLAPPRLRQVLVALSSDPSPHIRAVADSVLRDPSDPEHHKAFTTNSTLIRGAAHAALFSRCASDVCLPPRYDANLFAVPGTERLEVMPHYNAPVTALAFSLDHGSVASGSADGRVRWGDNEWSVCEKRISAILHLPGCAVAAAADDGIVYVLRHDVAATVDAFRPAIVSASRPIAMAAIPGSAVAFIAQGGCAVVVWDVAALLLIDVIQTPAVVTQFAIVGNAVYCAMENGVICKVNSKTYEIEELLDVLAGTKIVRIGDHRGMVYAVADNGAVHLWESGKLPKTVREGEKDVRDCLLHAELDGCVVVDEDGVCVGEAKLAAGGVVCCCLDSMRPLLAIGSADGSVAVWRLVLGR